MLQKTKCSSYPDAEHTRAAMSHNTVLIRKGIKKIKQYNDIIAYRDDIAKELIDSGINVNDALDQAADMIGDKYLFL